jgi:hypothetical protein
VLAWNDVDGKLVDYDYPEEGIAKIKDRLPQVPVLVA